MATNDVPGANPKNNDKLSRGCWAEHEDGSLIFVKDIDENDRVIFEIYDLSNDKHPVYYPQALTLKEFEKTFSYNPGKKDTSKIKWTWHDKTAMPWERVMRVIKNPLAVSANVQDSLTAATQVAESLRARIREVVTEDFVLSNQGIDTRPAGNQAKGIFNRLKRAMEAFVE